MHFAQDEPESMHFAQDDSESMHFAQDDSESMHFAQDDSESRVRVTDRHCRLLRRKINLAQKIINWRKQVAKKISPESPATEPYNCRACLSHLP